MDLRGRSCWLIASDGTFSRTQTPNANTRRSRIRRRQQGRRGIGMGAVVAPRPRKQDLPAAQCDEGMRTRGFTLQSRFEARCLQVRPDVRARPGQWDAVHRANHLAYLAESSLLKVINGTDRRLTLVRCLVSFR